jgi:uncharacterized coiled-coil protein SlyX
MEAQTTWTEEALRTLLERTAAQQASLGALAASVAEVRDGQAVMQKSINELQVDMATMKATAATQAEVERIRAELYKAIHEQTMRMLVWMTAVCSGLTAAVYYIARNVH